MRTHYWSCTTLADRIRGTPKPTALEWDAPYELGREGSLFQ